MSRLDRRFGAAAARLAIAIAIATVAVGGQSSYASAWGAPQALHRYLVKARAGDFGAVKVRAMRAGAKVVFGLPQIRLLVVLANAAARQRIAADPNVASIGRDSLVRVAPVRATAAAGRRPSQLAAASPRSSGAASGAAASFSPDPAFSRAGLMWDYNRIGLPAGWSVTAGQGWETVGVVSTGIDYNHSDLTTKVVGVKDFTPNEDPNLCSTQFGLPTDGQLATAFGTTSDEDFNGLGTYVAGQVAARVDGQGVNGIAPKVGLYALKVAQNCGEAYDSTVIRAILFAAREGIDVIDLPFAHYLNVNQHDQNLEYEAYAAAVADAERQGTAVIAAAGDQHADIGNGGRVISHGVLSNPPGGGDDYGLFEVPGGVAGAIAVSSTNGVVQAPSATCPSDSLAAGTHQWCKPASDPHQPFGAGRTNQLAYYSNYGPRIDIAAPGGARKFNLPSGDRGGAEGWPWTGQDSVEGGSSVADGFSAWQEFGITSNFATEVPCFTFTSTPGFPANQCYAIREGTAGASAHVAAVYALLLSEHPNLLGNVPALTGDLLASVFSANNMTPGLSGSDRSTMDSLGTPCTSGYCHLGGTAILNSDAYGAGIVTATLVSRHTLTVSKTGSGSGTVTSSPRGIACGVRCSADYPGGQSVSLHASPNAGSAFAGWSGACSGIGACKVTMSSDEAVTATFVLRPPNTAITSVTIDRTHHRATFRFKAVGNATGFQCALEKSPKPRQRPSFSSCHSPRTYRSLARAAYAFLVRAVGPGGSDPTPAKRSFTIG